jgi:hypothetical protein
MGLGEAMRYDITADELDLSSLEQDALQAVEAVVTRTVDNIAEGARRRVLMGPGVTAAGGPSGGPAGFSASGPGVSLGFSSQGPGVQLGFTAQGPGVQLGFGSDGPGVRTGELQASIVASVERQEAAFFGMVEVRSEYGRFVEYGTRYAAPRPFLTPAVEEQRPKVEPELLGGILGAVDRWINGVGAYPGAFPGSDVRTEEESRFWQWRFRD